MVVDEEDLQVMDVEIIIIEKFPTHTYYGTYILLTSINYSIETHLDLLSTPQSGVLIHILACCPCNY